MIGNPKILTLDEYRRVVEAKLGSKDFKIVSLEEAPFDQRVGLLADHARVHVGVDLPGGRREKLTFFAKGLPANENCRALVEEHGFFEKEKFFYEVLAKHFDRVPLSARTYPTCYLLKAGVFVLEDLGALGFKPVKSNLDPVDLDHCYQVTDAGFSQLPHLFDKISYFYKLIRRFSLLWRASTAPASRRRRTCRRRCATPTRSTCSRASS